MQNLAQFDCEALVIGTGLAGLNFALEFSQQNPTARVWIVTKSTNPSDGATLWAQGGIAAVFGDDDNPDLHIADTLRTGGGLSNPNVVNFVIREGRERVQEMIARGVPFSKRSDNQNEYDFTREGGHSRRRVLHVADHTGRAISETLVEKIQANPRIKILTNTIAVDLVSDQKILRKKSLVNATCLGAYLLDIEKNKVYPVRAAVTLLATGGAGKVYKYTSNPDTNNGDGLAMAHRIGAVIANMEFIQFHPTCLFHPQAKSALLSEALRGEGAFLLNSAGERFMEKYHPDMELAPRDIVSLSIDKEMKRRGDECVYLDISHKGEAFIKEHFPHNYENCLKFGFDLTKEAVPVVPAAHYTCGGVLSDESGHTNIRALFVAGEVAHTGLHGANRLASNSLLEAAVFSWRAAKAATEELPLLKELQEPSIPAWDHGFAKEEEEEVIVSHNWDEVRTLMWNYVGIVRSNRRLEYAARRIAMLKQEVNQCYWERKLSKNLVELRNLVTVADLIVKCSEQRKESRGLHQNIDYPETNNELFLKDSLV